MNRHSHKEKSITQQGNPGKPAGEAGEQMLERMNREHYEVTGWGLSFFEFDRRDVILDIGCGGGMTLSRLAEKVPEGEIYGVDYSALSVAKSKKMNKAAVESGRMKIVEGSVDALPFDSEMFDKITTVESFYFWPTPEKSLSEVYRVLKHGGVFMLIADIHGGAELTEDQLENIKRYDLRNPAPEEFELLFRTAGFDTAAVHTKEGTSWIAVEGRRK
ncbi:class I SAM-dependent methyltransferase [Schwartzia sp. (in: firmicutes)]